MFKEFLSPLFSLILVQVLQRLFYIVDSRFIGQMSLTALNVYNVQYQFYVVGQFLGLATGASALILLNRSRERGLHLLKRLALFHLGALVVFLATMAVLFPIFLGRVAGELNHHGFVLSYLAICSLNVVLVSISTALELTLIAVGRQTKVLLLHAFSNAFNLLLNAGAFFLFLLPEKNVGSGVLGIAAATNLILVALITISVRWLKDLNKETQPGDEAFNHDIRSVWVGEFGTILVRLVAPILYTYLVTGLDPKYNFLAISGFGIHLAYLLAMPITGGVQLALRAKSLTQKFKFEFWIFSVGSCVVLSLLAIGFPGQLTSTIYGVEIPAESIWFLRLYFLATLIGQIGHVFGVPIRRAKKNLWVTRNFFISEILIHQGLVFLLILNSAATPMRLGYCVCAFSTSYFLLTLFTNRFLPTPKESLV